MGPEENKNTIQIGRAARQAGLSIDTIRFYERGYAQAPARRKEEVSPLLFGTA